MGMGRQTKFSRAQTGRGGTTTNVSPTFLSDVQKFGGSGVSQVN